MNSNKTLLQVYTLLTAMINTNYALASDMQEELERVCEHIEKSLDKEPETLSLNDSFSSQQVAQIHSLIDKKINVHFNKLAEKNGFVSF